MELYLMQHAAALPKEAHPEEPLSPSGRDAAAKSARAMARLGLRPEALVHSPKERSRQTARIVAEALDLHSSVVTETEAVKAMTPAADTLRLVQDLERAGAASVLVVGHLPNLPELARLLCGLGHRADGVRGLRFQNAGLTRLDCADLWAASEDGEPRPRAELVFHLTPALLQRLAD